MNFNLVDAVKSNIVSNELSVSDITVCICVRASEITPWIIQRLMFTLGFYDPSPNFMIIDFGSKEPYSEKIREICKSFGSELVYVSDYDEFSSSKARNIGFKNSKTEFILFSDVDFVYERDFFDRLTSIAAKLDLKANPMKVISMPIFHLNKKATTYFEELDNNSKQDKILARWGVNGLGTEFGTLFEFIVPYSNTFLIHRDMFNLSGGYCDEFRGHGSEDFEFLIRLARLTTNVPPPDELSKDFYGPLKESFWGDKEYAGFRRYLEVFTLPCESLGLKAFHLWHEKPASKGYWTRSNDWKRERFNIVFNQYAESNARLLNVDYLEREKSALCIFSDEAQWGYFLPLRLAGYKLTILNEKVDDEIIAALRMVENKKVDRIFIFNPYMKSHVMFRGIVEVAKKVGVSVTVIERGGLPNSLYYADEVAYGDDEYHRIYDELSFDDFTENQIKLTGSIIETLRKGNHSLESMQSYEDTWGKHTLLRFTDKKKIFIPLQLRDDMAVRYFTEGYTSYEFFEEGIKEAVVNNEDVIFIIKQHPLSKYDMTWTEDYVNVILTSQDDNIHALIDISDAVGLYNSGVGLLAIAHRKPLYNVGNAYYNSHDRLSIRKNSVSEIVADILKNTFSMRDDSKVKLFFSWLIFKKYSWFTAQDLIRDFVDRKAHAYDYINVGVLNFNKHTYISGWDLYGCDYSPRSYLNWHLRISDNNGIGSKNINNSSGSIKKQGAVNETVLNEMLTSDSNKNVGKVWRTRKNIKKKTIIGYVFISLFNIFVSGKKKIKLKETPDRFFNESNFSLLKWIGKIAFK